MTFVFLRDCQVGQISAVSAPVGKNEGAGGASDDVPPLVARVRGSGRDRDRRRVMTLFVCVCVCRCVCGEACPTATCTPPPPPLSALFFDGALSLSLCSLCQTVSHSALPLSPSLYDALSVLSLPTHPLLCFPFPLPVFPVCYGINGSGMTRLLKCHTAAVSNATGNAGTPAAAAPCWLTKESRDRRHAVGLYPSAPAHVRNATPPAAVSAAACVDPLPRSPLFRADPPAPPDPTFTGPV